MKPAVSAKSGGGPRPVWRGFGFVWLIICLAGVQVSAAAPPADQTWLARWGDRQVQAGEFQAYVDKLCRRNPNLRLTDEVKQDLLEKYVEKCLLLAEANRLNLAQDPEVINDLEEAREQVLLKQLFQRQATEFEAQVQISEAELSRYFAESGRQIHFRHLSVPDGGQGKKLLDRWREHEPPAGLIDSGMVKFTTLSAAWQEKLRNLPRRDPQLVKIGADYFLVEVLARADVGPPSARERDKVRQELLEIKKNEMMAAWIKRLKDNYRAEINKSQKSD